MERIVWPHVKTVLEEKIGQIKESWLLSSSSSSSQKEKGEEGDKKTTKYPIVILEAAVLLDAEWDDILDGIWIVKAEKEIALNRLMETRGLSQEEAEKRIVAQESRRGIGNLQDEVNNGIVTGVITNDGNLEDLQSSLASKLQDSTSWKN